MRLRRRRVPELMDSPQVDRGELARSLRDLEVINNWLGGTRTALRLVLDLAERVPHRPVRILDVGTGGADIPLELVRAASERGVAIELRATDLHPETVAFARRATHDVPAIEVERADALQLPYEDAAFDLVMNHTMLHHFGPADAFRALREMNRVARYGVVLTDLARSWAALTGARALAATLWRRHPITRHDGPVSVRAAYTPGELATLARAAVGPGWRVQRHLLFRLSLVVDRTPPPGGGAGPQHRGRR